MGACDEFSLPKHSKKNVKHHINEIAINFICSRNDGNSGSGSTLAKQEMQRKTFHNIDSQMLNTIKEVYSMAQYDKMIGYETQTHSTSLSLVESNNTIKQVGQHKESLALKETHGKVIEVYSLAQYDKVIGQCKAIDSSRASEYDKIESNNRIKEVYSMANNKTKSTSTKTSPLLILPQLRLDALP